MSGIPSEADILRSQLREAEQGNQYLAAQVEMLAFQRRTYEEMLAAAVRDLGEYKGNHTYVAAISREGLSFSSKPFVSDIIPDLALGGVNLRFKGGPEAEAEAVKRQAELEEAVKQAGFTLLGPDGRPTQG